MSNNSVGSNFVRLLVIIVVIAVMVFSGCSGCSNKNTGTTSSKASNGFVDLRKSNGTEVKDPDASLTAEDELESGTVLDGSEYGYARISVAASSNASAYIKVLNPDDTLQVEFYVRAGEEGYVDVPQGTYNVHFAQGKTWYGTEDRFGSKTVYGKDDGVELFSYGEGVQYSLTYTTNGNLHLKKLNKNDF